MSFFVTLQSNFQHVMLYESSELQQEARTLIPQEQLLSSAEHNLDKAKGADPGEPSRPGSVLIKVWKPPGAWFLLCRL